MSAQQNHTVWSGYLSGSSGALSAGYCVCLNSAGTYYVVATSANRSAASRTTAVAGIAITSADDTNPSFELQTVGPCPPSITGLGAGAAGPIIVNSSGLLERKTTPADSDIVAGKCDADGWAYLNFSARDGAAGAAASAAGSDTQVQFNDGGSFGADSDFTWNKTSNLLSVGSAIATGGGTPSTVGFWRTPYATTQTLLATKNSGGTDITVLQRLGSGFTYRLGDADNLNVDIYGSVSQFVGKSTWEAFSGSSLTSLLYSDGTVAKVAQPLAGNSASSVPFRWKTATVSCASVSSVTLSAAQYQCPHLLFSGTPTTDVTVTAPLYDGAEFVIKNRLGSAASLTFKGASGTGVTVANNKNAIVYCDGTNYERLTPDTSP